MSLKAVGFRIIVKPNDIIKKTPSGIVIAVDEKLEKGAVTSGTIVDIGEDAFVAYRPKTEFCGLKVGDQIHYPRYAGKGIKDETTKEELLVIHDEDVIAVER